MALADIRSEIPRTFIHVLGGCFLAMVGYVPAVPINRFLLCAVFVAALFMEGARLAAPQVKGLVRAVLGPFMRPSEEDGLTGALPFTGGVFLAFLVFSKSVALASMVPLVFGDRAGLLVGKSIGKVGIGKKTLEGSMACFTATLAAYLVLGRIWPAAFDLSTGVVLSASLIGALAEALPRPFDDNLTIPVAVGIFLSLAV